MNDFIIFCLLLLLPFLHMFSSRLMFKFNPGLYIDLFIPKEYREIIWEAINDK